MASPESPHVSTTTTLTSTSATPYGAALLAGAFAGTAVDLSLYPIDTLKTRLQSAQGFRAAGGFRGVYAGVGSAALGAAPGAALFFVSYEATKHKLKAWRQGSTSGAALDHMAAASLGEIAACAVRVPTEVVKQRAQAAEFPSSMSALRYILAQRTTVGIPGVWRELYRGWGITVMREVPFTVIQFPLWEAMKEAGRKRAGTREVGALESALYGSISGAVAASATTPLDVLKTRLMLARQRTSLSNVFALIMRESGARGLFAGIVPRVMWISGGGAIFLGSYQFVYNIFTAAS